MSKIFVRACFLILAVSGILDLPVRPVHASEFMDVEISGPVQEYVVLRDLNVRVKPDTKSKRIDGLKMGQTIRSPGQHKGWAAVLSDQGAPLGFAYKKFLLPVLNGELDEPVDGTAGIANGGLCSFSIAFDGKSEANAAAFKIADYEVDLHCTYDKKTLVVTMFMFMTEGPVTNAKPSRHQIGMDLLQIELDGAADRVFSTTVMYDHDKQLITYDDITAGGYGEKPAKSERTAKTLPEALSGAVRMALESWTAKTWGMLSAHQN